MKKLDIDKLTRFAERVLSALSGSARPLCYSTEAVRNHLDVVAPELVPFLLGNGADRAAFLVDGVVLKVPVRSAGVRSNRREYDVYSNSSAKLKRHLVPTLTLLSNGTAVQEYAPALPRYHGWRRLGRVGAVVTGRMEQEFPGMYYDEYRPDLHQGNYSRDGRIFDYAGFDEEDNDEQPLSV